MRGGYIGKAKFCPFCGVATIQQDNYADERKKKSFNNRAWVDFICSTCNHGFRLLPSYRHQVGAAIAAQHRVGRFVDDSQNEPHTVTNSVTDNE